MKTRNILKLFTTFSALFLINGVKAATLTEIPKCDTANSNSKYGGYCLNDEKLKKYTNGSEDTTTITEGLHFILNGCDDELSAAQTSASPVFLVNVTTNKDVVETISKGYYLDNANNIVNCISETKCIFYDTTSVPSGCPSFLIQNPLSGKSLIKIDGTTISDTEIKDGYYVSANVPQLIQCRNNDCKEVSASVTNVYIDAAGEANSLIKCVDGVTGSIQCKSELITSDANFINSGELDKATKPIIKCTSTKCEASEITESNVYYQDTMEGSKVIHCTPGKCTKVDGAGGDVYVAKKDGEGETDGIIVCTDDDSGNITCIPPTSIATDSYYLIGRSVTTSIQIVAISSYTCWWYTCNIAAVIICTNNNTISFSFTVFFSNINIATSSINFCTLTRGTMNNFTSFHCILIIYIRFSNFRSFTFSTSTFNYWFRSFIKFTTINKVSITSY